MTRLSLLVPLALLSGCIIYDTRDGKCPGCDKDDWWSDTGDVDHDDDSDGDGIPDGEDTDSDTDGDAASAFTLTPNVGEIGTTFIASLTTDVGFDFGTVEGVELYGDAEVLASESRSDELLLTISVPASAAPGTVDLLLLLPEDRVEFLGGALTLVAAGTDAGDDGSDPDADDGTDDGSGSSDDGTDDGTDDGSDGSGCP